MCTYKWDHITVNTGQIIFKFSPNINDMFVIKLHFFLFRIKQKVKKCERKTQIYGKIKVHIFSNTLERPNLIEYITKQSKYHNILKSNPAAASMSM